MNKREIVDSIRYALYSCIPDHDDVECLTSAISHRMQSELPRVIREALERYHVAQPVADRCVSAVFHEFFKEVRTNEVND